ncbi:hypothetical protein [Mycoplasma crocodyli]|uniref:DUF1934 domain-containing protein n=1 Tax=Mycoplasma crocodyli (strain ATCC 51981 / MP145) TaxID=512564 RepID=D5E5U9_MYCCM|nr:hypothetical protein [Mycoplasma crocodyli]ADE19978.1 conserved hypothetical protein [Mycoplasma crocodyli MP145]
MKIKFLSVSLQNEEEKKIEFTSELERSYENGFDVLFFKEPTKGIPNQIEIKEGRINIFAGPTTLMMKSNQWSENPFELDLEGKITSITLYTFLKYLDYDNEKQIYKFGYDLSYSPNNKDLIGQFNVTLEIE